MGLLAMSSGRMKLCESTAILGEGSGYLIFSTLLEFVNGAIAALRSSHLRRGRYLSSDFTDDR